MIFGRVVLKVKSRGKSKIITNQPTVLPASPVPPLRSNGITTTIT
jgi:hypothetical protein